MIERVRVKPKRKRAEAKRKHFTEINVLRLRPKKVKQYLIWDAGTGAERGLAILVSPMGTKSYRCAYYYPGNSKPHYMHLGRVGEMTLAEARQRCRDARGKARKGDDPTAGSLNRSDSFKTAVDTYTKHEQIGRRHNRSAHKTEAVILRSCKDWHSRPVATIRYQEIDNLLQVIRDGDADLGLKPRPYLANRVYSHLADFFGWCVRSKRIAASPMTDMRRPWEAAKPRDRDWFKKEAADTAIKSLWRTADEIGGSEGRYLKVLILTGKRKTALAKMRWEQIDADWFWDAPPSEAKNKRLHGVPLARLAQRQLHPRQSDGLVFGEINLDKLEKNIRKLSSVSDFFFHGVRHLVETKTAALRDAQHRSLILPHVRDLLFDHVPPRGAGAGYDHHDYLPEMRAAAEVWANYVDQLVKPEGAALLR